MKTFFKILFVLVLISGLVFFGYPYFMEFKDSRTGGGQVAPKKMELDVCEVETDDVQNMIELFGKVRSFESVNITSPVNAKIKTVEVQNGSLVNQGDVLIRLNIDDLIKDFETAKIEYAKAKAALGLLENWKSSYEYLKARAEVADAKISHQEALQIYQENLSLYEQKAISKNELDRSKMEIRSKKSELTTAEVAFKETRAKANETALEEARLKLKIAQIDLKNKEMATTQKEIISPITGIVALSEPSAGSGDSFQKVITANSKISAGDLLMTITNHNQYVVEAPLNEYDLFRVKVGQPCYIRMPAIPSQPLTGHVSTIAPNTQRGGDTTYQVRCKIDQRLSTLKPGLSAALDLLVAESTDVLVVPISALVKSGRQNGVFVIQEGKPQFQGIEIGISDGDIVEVRGGLGEGQFILCEVPSRLLTSLSNQQ